MLCQLSVRDFVEFLYQSGDLAFSSSSTSRANLGSRIHRMLQASATGDYQSEVYLKIEMTVDNVDFVIDGRADGIFIKDGCTYIEEIKTTAIPYEDIQDDHKVHFAQAYCYAYIYALQHELVSVMIQLTYYQIDSKKIKKFEQLKSIEELKTFFMESLSQYLLWAKLSQTIRINSATSLRTLHFPFDEYRKGQRVFANGVYKSILDKRNLFAQAPTGIGKTISTLFPALKAIGEGKIDKIFYLCAKNITAGVAYDTLSLLYQQNLSFKTVGISAKDKICFLDERNCDPKHCPYAKGYFDRNKDALFELLNQYDFIDRDNIQSIAMKHTVCPFELSLDASLYADVIVCDYNYAFDPRVYLKRFFMEKTNHILLVDEAHNLVDRAREMYSAVLDKESFLHLKRTIPKGLTKLQRHAQAIIGECNKLKAICGDTSFYADTEPFLSLLEKVENFAETCDTYFQGEHDDQYDDLIKDLYFQSLNFIRIADFYDEHFVSWILLEHKNVTIKQFCMNPRNPLAEVMKKVRSTILFSATLSPIEYYLELLGGNENTNRLSLPSPFHKEQLYIIVNNAISTRYHDRESSLLAIVEMIHASILAKDGNYIVFTPSYAYMNQIATEFIAHYPTINISIQEGNMKEEEKQSFLQSFQKTTTMHLHFCVLGGMFSEGIDLKGDQLLGAIMIGVGLPQINPQQDLIKAHFDERNHMGFAYAYQFPGMNKVLQGAGRVIRSEHDKGIIVFIDERFTSHQYKGLLPAHLRHYNIINEPQRVFTSLSKFWKG